MAWGWRLAYRLGITPWERAAEHGHDQLEVLLDKIETDRAQPLGRALDIGCGTGRHTHDLAVGRPPASTSSRSPSTRPASRVVRRRSCAGT